MRIYTKPIDHISEPARSSESLDAAWDGLLRCVRAWKEWMAAPTLGRLEHAKQLTQEITFDDESELVS